MRYFLIFKCPGRPVETVMYYWREDVEREIKLLAGYTPAIQRDNSPIWVISDNEYIVIRGEIETSC